MDPALPKSRFWRRVCKLTLALLSLWLLVNLAGPWLARDLDGIRVLGYPLAFWVAAQGALLLYLGIIVVYCIVMERLEAQFQAEMRDEGAGPDSA